MQKKSALTAALSGAPAAPAPAPSRAKSKWIGNKVSVDNYAFPCLACAEDDGSLPTLTSDSSAAVADVEFPAYTPVGSAPTSTSLKDGTPLADYDLNPFGRRGGKEAIPDIAASLEKAGSLAAPGSIQSNYISEAVIGSLPKGLTADEKARIAASTPLSPALNMLSELPVDKVAGRTLEGKKLRRHVLKGSVVAFITAGYSGKRFIFEKAKELGVRSVVVDGPDSWVQVLKEEGIIEAFVPIDFSDTETVFDRIYEGLKKVASKLGSIDGVTTYCEIAVPLVSRLAEKFGLPGNSPEAVDAARDKFKTREALQRAELPSPRHYLIKSTADLAAAGVHVGFPAVIKPISGAASIGVIRVDDQAQLEKNYRKVLKDMRCAKIVAGALVQGDTENTPDDDVDGSFSSSGVGSLIDISFMMEEYLDGTEVDVDLVLSEGLVVYGAVTDNWPTVEPYFNETGSNCPSVLTRKQQAELIDLCMNSVLALGFKLGVFHVEAKYTTRGPRLIEVNCRMGGGPVRDTNLLVWGVDLVEEHLLSSVGIPCRPLIARQPLVHMAEFSVNAQTSGKLLDVDFVKPYQDHPDVLYCRPLVQPGSKCVCVADGLPTWVCELMVTKPTVKEAIEFVKQMEAGIQANMHIV